MASVPIVEIMEQLHKRGVPLRHPVKRHQMTQWERVVYFAQNYNAIEEHFNNDLLKRQIFGGEPTVFQQINTVLEQQGKLAVISTVESSVPLIAPTVEPVVPELQLTKCQDKAWSKLTKWLKSENPYFVLRGYAGTGKTYLLKKLKEQGSHTFLYTAPTHKAAKVLGEMLGTRSKTLHSALGLRMEAEEDGMMLALPDLNKLPYIRPGTILVVDECGMVNKQLAKFVEIVRKHLKLRVIYVGDPMQLNPVKEKSSPTWKATEDKACRALLKEVKRYDNQLLNLATNLRACIKAKDWTSPVVDDHDANGGVFVLPYHQWRKALLANATPERFAKRKFLAWRNKTVERYNKMIRDALGFTDQFCVHDRLMIAAPVEQNGVIVATIDEEGVVTSVVDSVINCGDESAVPVYKLTLKMEDGRSLTISVPQEEHEDRLMMILNKKSAFAKRQSDRVMRREAWDVFWSLKKQFSEVRYGYALTAHRAQGSTYEEVYVDHEDVMANPDKREAFRCFYVLATRPTTSLFTF